MALLSGATTTTLRSRRRRGRGRSATPANVVVPQQVPAGKYRIGVGLYDGGGTGDRLEMKTSGGAASTGGKRYDVGTLKVG